MEELTLQDVANTIAFLRTAQLTGEQSATHAMLMQKYTMIGNKMQEELQNAEAPKSPPTQAAAAVKKAARKSK